MKVFKTFSISIIGLCCVFFASGCHQSSSRNTSKIFDRFEVVGSFGTGVGHFNKPRSIAVDRKGVVHVVDMTGRVQRFDSSGQYLNFWQAPETTLGRPKGMGIDQIGNLILVEPHYQRITHFDSYGKPIRTWGKKGNAPGELAFPRAVVADSKGNLFICEYLEVQRIQKFDAQANFIKTWGSDGAGPSEFRRPEGLGVDGDDNIYVADSCNHRIQKFSNNGEFISQFGKPGTGLGELNYPYDVKVDQKGRVYVCEFGNNRIQIFSLKGEPLEIIGGEGSGEWQFYNPWGIALDSENNLWVADAMNHRVIKLIAKK
jgi:DNA-binding beta-propeller fold protein YncE